MSDRGIEAVAGAFVAIPAVALVGLLAVYSLNPGEDPKVELVESRYGSSVVESGVVFTVDGPVVGPDQTCVPVLVDNEGRHPVTVDPGPWKLRTTDGEEITASVVESEQSSVVPGATGWSGEVCFGEPGEKIAEPEAVSVTWDEDKTILWKAD